MFKDIYSLNSCFEPQFIRLDFDSELTDSLERYYGLVEDTHSRLTSKSVEAALEESTAILREIFSAWISQAEKELQKRFLVDLLGEAIFLLRQDFSYIKRFRTTKCSFPVDSYLGDEGRALRENKFLVGCLSNEDVGILLSAGKDVIKDIGDAEARGAREREDLSRNSGRSIKEMVHTLDTIFKRQGINQAVSSYMGVDMKVGSLALESGSRSSSWWRSHLAKSSGDPGTLYMHRDEAFAYPKAFIYLSKIDSRSGPFGIVPNADTIHGKPSLLQSLIGRRINCVGLSQHHKTYGSFATVEGRPMGCETFRSLFLSLPKEARYSSHYGWDIPEGDPIHKQLQDDEYVLQGPAGTFTVFDGARITHRALVNSSRDHLSIQAVFVDTCNPLRRASRKVAKLLKMP